MTLTNDAGTSNLVAVEPGAIREDTPPGSVIQYSDYELDELSPFAGGAAWIEGEYVPASEARISLFDTGFGHSDLTYTVAHVWHGNVFRLDDHMDRLYDGARKLRLDPGMSKEEMAEIGKRCVALSQLRESFLNFTITRGYGKKRGEKDLTQLTHQVYVYAIPYLWVFPPYEQINGTSAIVPRHVRRAGRNTGPGRDQRADRRHRSGAGGARGSGRYAGGAGQLARRARGRHKRGWRHPLVCFGSRLSAASESKLPTARVGAHGSVRFHHRWRGFLFGQGLGIRSTRCGAAGAWLQGPPEETGPVSQRRSRHHVADPAWRGVRHR